MGVLGAPRGLEGMQLVPGGMFAMGSADFYPEEAPVRRVEVEGFGWRPRAARARVARLPAGAPTG
jgi:hypothetical protein